MKFRKSHREEVPVSMDDTAPSAPEGAAPAASGPNDAPADPAAPRYKFPTWFDLLALVGLFVVIQLVVAFVLLLAGARRPRWAVPTRPLPPGPMRRPRSSTFTPIR